MITIVPTHPRFTMEMLGYLPSFISDVDDRPAREQFDANYVFGTSWKGQTDFRILLNGNLKSVRYYEDPQIVRIAEAQLRDETIVFFSNAYVAIIQPDGNYVSARMD
jgi:hypothetical protein